MKEVTATFMEKHHYQVESFRMAGVVQFESSHLTIAMEAWKPTSLKAMPPQSNIM